jgi:LPXTG-site transpeptidase (sortase) family protein
LLKKNKQLSLSLSIIIVLGFALLLFLGLILRSTSLAKNTTLPLQEKAISLLPIHLKIPTINVDADFEYVGLTRDGAMDAPKGPAPVGWYSLGPRPGDIGSAVIDGHSGWKNNIPAVFDNLYKLKKGDEIYIENDTGVTTTFIVREIRKYDPNADASDVFISNDGKSHLNLITCTGIWNETTKSRSERLVVFTDKVSQ